MAWTSFVVYGKVDCHKKMVAFKKPDKKVVKFEGERGRLKQSEPVLANIREGEAERRTVVSSSN